MNVEQIVSSAAQQTVNDLQRGVLLGRTQLAVLVGNEQTLVANVLLRTAGSRLTAAADAAAGAGHDLDKVEEFLSAFNLLNELVGIAQTAHDRDLERELARRDLECLDALETAHTAFRDGRYLLGCGCADNVADDCLGNAAGDA